MDQNVNVSIYKLFEQFNKKNVGMRKINAETKLAHIT